MKTVPPLALFALLASRAPVDDAPDAPRAIDDEARVCRTPERVTRVALEAASYRLLSLPSESANVRNNLTSSSAPMRVTTSRSRSFERIAFS